MFFRKKKQENPEPRTSPGRDRGAGTSDSAKITLRPSAGEKPVRREFPGPRQPKVILRVAFERSAYAELIAHAKESLEAEVCGVVAGQVCEDGEGVFVHVEAAIRGTAASGGSTHVTFTQATWNGIHATLEQQFPKLRIVGWYHTHPGFGVEFSDMDLFIQRNFFSAATQIAVVMDPLNGAVAICINTPQGIEYLTRFWVDGREQICQAPAKSIEAGTAPTSSDRGGTTAAALSAMESRLSQLVQAMDEQRRTFYRFLTTIGLIVSFAAVTAVGYFIYSEFRSRNEPPRVNTYVPVPVQIGDKTVLLGVAVVDWTVPPELNALQLQLEKLKADAADKAAKAASNNGKAGTTVPSVSRTNTPSR